MKIAFLGNLPVSTVFPGDCLRKTKLSYEHPAPWIAALLPRLAEISGYDIKLVVPHRNIVKYVEITRDNVTYVGVPAPVPMRFARSSFYHTISHFTNPVLRKLAPDVVHAFGYETGNAIIALRSGLPVSCFIQGIAEKLYPYYTERSLIDRYVGRWGELAAVPKVKWMVAETEFARDWALSRHPNAYVKIIPHPLRENFLNAGGATYEKQVVVVGGLDSRKGVDTIIKGFAYAQVSNSRLVIVGGGPLKENLEQLAKHLDIDQSVTFTGAIDAAGVIEQMQKSSCLVMGSRMDTSPNVISEAHAIGLPVIGTRAGGIPEMIAHEVDGYLVDVDDDKAMGHYINQLLNDQSLAQKMGENGRQKVLGLNSSTEVAEAHLDFFDHIKREL